MAGRSRKPIEWVRDGECIICTSHARDKYGYIKATQDGKAKLLHRLVCEKWNGICLGMHAIHSCDCPPCINPAHLRWGTHRDNMKDRSIRNRVARGSSAGNVKLTEENVIEIRSSTETETYSVIAKRFGVKAPCISQIKNMKTWKHLRKCN